MGKIQLPPELESFEQDCSSDFGKITELNFVQSIYAKLLPIIVAVTSVLAGSRPPKVRTVKWRSWEGKPRAGGQVPSRCMRRAPFGGAPFLCTTCPCPHPAGPYPHSPAELRFMTISSKSNIF